MKGPTIDEAIAYLKLDRDGAHQTSRRDCHDLAIQALEDVKARGKITALGIDPDERTWRDVTAREMVDISHSESHKGIVRVLAKLAILCQHKARSLADPHGF